MLDIVFTQRLSKRCDGITRRDFVRVGGLSALGLSLAGYLRATTSARPAGGSEPRGARARSAVLVFLGGGLSHHDTFDLKPDAPAEIRGEYSPIATNVPGLQISERLPLLAQCMDKVTLIRSGAHNNDHHETATNWVLSGRLGSAFGDYPAMGAVVSHELGFRGTVPPYVAIPRNPSFTWELGKSAFLGGRYESFSAGDPNQLGYRVRDVTLSQQLSAANLERRRSLLSAVDTLARRVEGNDQIATYDEFQQRAQAMILSSETRRAFAIEEEPTALRDRYGRNTFGQSMLLARRLVEAGVRFVTVNYAGWDHHGRIFTLLRDKLFELDHGLSCFLQDMEVRGLMDETLLIVMGEFGRTPRINRDAGRDHWGPAASLLFAGAGVARGQVIGATDRHGAYVTRRPIPPADVAYTIFDSLGIDPRRQLQTPDGRPLEILDEGESIRELFA